MRAVDEHRYDDARDAVLKLGNSLLERYVEWSILQVAEEPDVDISSIRRFLHENPDWPGLEVLGRKSGAPITAEAADASTKGDLADIPALSRTESMRHIAATTAPGPQDTTRGRRPIPEASAAIAVHAANAVIVIKGAAPFRLAEKNLSSGYVRWFGQSRDPGDTKLARSVLFSAQDGAGGQANPRGKDAPPAEAEFRGGWIALRQLGRVDDALKHFLKLHDGARSDVAKSRAAYWLGRTYEAAGRFPAANAWYFRAAGFQQTFYGQLAARKAPGTLAARPGDPFANSVQHQSLAGHELVDVVNYLGQIGEFKRTRPFLLMLARMVRGPGEVALLARLAVELRQSDIAATITRSVAGGLPFFDATAPMVDIGGTGEVERALVMAVANQESGFNVGAASASGALGVMQIMPGTAREMAAQLGVPFVQDNLTRNSAYNVALGTRYLAGMLKRFSGSYELALAAYNAGPNRVALWLASHGDPRTGEIDMVDWIEMIPFDETRNYVQRVMEGVSAYRKRLNP